LQFLYAHGVKTMPSLVQVTIYFEPEYSLVVITQGSSGRHMLQQSQHLIWVQITKKIKFTDLHSLVYISYMIFLFIKCTYRILSSEKVRAKSEF
jgi:hypothetical protein